MTSANLVATKLGVAVKLYMVFNTFLDQAIVPMCTLARLLDLSGGHYDSRFSYIYYD